MLNIATTALTATTATTAPPPLDKAHMDLKKATQQFESYFLHQLLKEMRKTVPEDGLLADDGQGKEIFQDMMDQTLSDSMSSRGDLGMAKMMYDQLAPRLGADTGQNGPQRIISNAGTQKYTSNTSPGTGAANTPLQTAGSAATGFTSLRPRSLHRDAKRP